MGRRGEVDKILRVSVSPRLRVGVLAILRLKDDLSIIVEQKQMNVQFALGMVPAHFHGSF